ncbi:hypothetical protein [Rheinheimera sp.]|uniref:hypothetical protein n=1 Tax=Rheinheimera sp. TaxID=1869214 RepID=UPI00307EA826
MARLTKAQIDGIRLVADVIVIEQLLSDVYQRQLTPKQLTALRNHLEKNVPKPFAAKAELAKQINLVRAEWLKQLKEDNEN